MNETHIITLGFAFFTAFATSGAANIYLLRAKYDSPMQRPQLSPAKKLRFITSIFLDVEIMDWVGTT